MSFTIDLSPDVERRLRVKAAQRHLLLEAYVGDVVRRDAETDDEASGSIEKRLEALDRILGEMDDFGRRVPTPSLPDSALTREAIYGDHD